MRLIGRSFRAHPIPHAIAITGAILFAVSVVALSRAIAWVTDELIVPGLGGDGVSNQQLLTGFLIILLIALVRGAGAVVRRYYLAMAEYRTGGTWRAQLYAQYLRQPLSFATVVLAFLAIISLALVHPLFGVVAVVLLPILMIINQAYSSRVAGPAAEVQQAVAEVTNVAHESFDGIMVVKTLGRTDDEVARMREASEDLRSKRLRVGGLRAIFEPLLETLPSLGVVVILLLGARLVDDGTISVGDVVGAMSLFSVLSLPIRIVGFFLQSMPASVVALERIDGVLDLPFPEAHHGNVDALPEGPLPLRFDGVSFAHGANIVLDELDLEIGAGETLALVGATGSGKTTLLELTAGLISPNRGTIALGGVGQDDLLPLARAARLGVVFQETFLFAESIRENITMGDPAHDDAVFEAARASNAHAFILETPDGYDTVVGERGVTLSGGQRQRVALARALFRAPSLLLLDDATSALDPSVEAEILRGLDGRPMTILMVAHRLSTIALAYRIAFLDEGKIVATGTHNELLGLDGYRTLVQAYEEA